MKHTHTEGPGSILKSRFARGVLPLMAALLAFALSCALAAVAADAKDPKKDPRRNYSSDGWKLAWSD